MDNIMDYLDWRGDVPLMVSALNPVDGYIFCTLAALNFEGIVPETGEGITVREAAEAYFTQGRGDYLGVLCTPWAGPWPGGWERRPGSGTWFCPAGGNGPTGRRRGNLPL